ncbi:MAG: hypothetical protein JWM55_1856 [Acidimicrobiaceae bacterium]|nr:hypothetical protein [Acidimicrobiaceae bacterium]
MTVSRAFTRMRSAPRLFVVFGVGALILASCTAAPTSAPRALGTPAFSISVPLTNVGCTRNDVCVAVGTSSVSVGPNAVGEYASPGGRWFHLTLPPSPSPVVDAAACSGTTCLFGGSGPRSDLLWLFNANGDTVDALTAPPGGIGIESLACHDLICALVDTGVAGDVPRLSVSSDGGRTWGAPTALPWAKGEAVTTLSCGTLLACAIGTLSATHQFSLRVTEDGGTTWSTRPTPSAWTSLRSLSCAARRCVALASEGETSALVRSRTFTRTWSSLTLPAQANTLACTTFSTCFVAGQRSNGAGWLARVHDRAVTTVQLRYVPTPLLGAACGTKVCAAVGVTTVLSIPSTL